MVESKFAEK